MNRLRAVLPIFALAATIALTGCHKKVPQQAIAPPPPPPPAAPPPPPPPPPPPRAEVPRQPTEDELFNRKSLDDLNREMPLSDAYFDLDKSEIRADARTALQKDADWMKRWTSTRVNVEGHCDERGSAAYNLGLGSRRAQAVKDYLVNLGVAASRIDVVSKGKEAPVCTEKNESCWQMNRRGHFIISAK